MMSDRNITSLLTLNSQEFRVLDDSRPEVSDDRLPTIQYKETLNQ
jgi:hypothetical protein